METLESGTFQFYCYIRGSREMLATFTIYVAGDYWLTSIKWNTGETATMIGKGFYESDEVVFKDVP